MSPMETQPPPSHQPKRGSVECIRRPVLETAATHVHTVLPAYSQLDAEILSDLPLDVRNEVLSAYNLTAPQLQASALLRHTLTKNLQEINDVRIVLRNWIVVFGETEPIDEDVVALIHYLSIVIRGEKRITKAVIILNWFQRIVNRLADEGKHFQKEQWRSKLEMVQNNIEDVARQSGLQVNHQDFLCLDSYI